MDQGALSPYPLRMRHLEHGWCYANTSADEQRMRAAGWVDEAQPAPIQSPPVEVDKRKPGRPRKVKDNALHAVRT